MGLETGTYISALNAANPVTGDNKTEGDDHIRLIKATVLNTFPNVTGAVTATHSELNVLGPSTTITTSGWHQKITLSTESTITYDTSLVGAGRYVFMGASANGNFYCGRSQLNNGTTAPNYSFLMDTAGVVTFFGVIKANNGGQGLGAITVSTSAPSGGALGDIWIQY